MSEQQREADRGARLGAIATINLAERKARLVVG